MDNWRALCGRVSDAEKEEMLGDSVLLNGIDCRTGIGNGKGERCSLVPRASRSSSSSC